MEKKPSRYEYNKEYVKTYLKNSVDERKVRLPKGQWDNIKNHAESMGESANGFIIRAINETMVRDKSQE